MTPRTIIPALQDHPKVIAWIGTIYGWAAFDLLRTAQIVAAILAAAVSLCALILTLPKAIKEVRGWFPNDRNS